MQEKEMSQKQQNIYRNLKGQIEKEFRGINSCSFKTRERYQNAMYDFAKFLACKFNKQNMRKVNNGHIKAYVDHLHQSGCSKSYETTNLSAIRFYYDMTTGGKFKIWSNRKLGARSRSIDDRIGSDKAFSEGEYAELLKKSKNGEDHLQIKIKLGFHFGLRIHETLKLRHSQIRDVLKNDYIEVLGKGGKIRKIPLDNKQRELLKEANQIKSSGCDRIFVGVNEKTHIKIKELQKQICKIRGNSKKTYHCLRHKYAQNMYKRFLQEGMDDKEARKLVSELLGHGRLGVTYIYVPNEME